MTTPPTMGTEPGDLLRRLRHECAASNMHDHDGCSCTDDELLARARIDRPSGEHAELVERLKGWCTDWNGAAMVRGEPPRDGLHCDILYDAASVIASQDERIASLERDRDEARADAKMYEATAKEAARGLECLTDIDEAWDVLGTAGNRGALTLAEQIASRERELEAAEARADALAAVVRALLKCEYDGAGLTDCIDSDGQRYQSAELAKTIERAESIALNDPTEKTEVAPPEQTQAVEDRT